MAKKCGVNTEHGIHDDEVVWQNEYSIYANASHQLIIILFDRSVLPLSTCF